MRVFPGANVANGARPRPHSAKLFRQFPISRRHPRSPSIAVLRMPPALVKKLASKYPCNRSEPHDRLVRARSRHRVLASGDCHRR